MISATQYLVCCYSFVVICDVDDAEMKDLFLCFSATHLEVKTPYLPTDGSS